MKKSAERTARQRKENRQTVFVLFAVIAFVIAAVCAFLGFYTSPLVFVNNHQRERTNVSFQRTNN